MDAEYLNVWVMLPLSTEYVLADVYEVSTW